MKYNYANINDYTKDELEKFYKDIYYIKKRRIDKLRVFSAKTRSIIGEILLKENLSKYKNIDYNSLEFGINNFGKPYIKNKNIYFNISHSYDYVISIISDKPIGIDIEKIRDTSLNTISKFATEKERKYILENDEDCIKRLWQIYTLKEAYFKMKGVDLKEIFSIEFLINDDLVICNDKDVNIGFINDISGYIIAYCKKRNSN